MSVLGDIILDLGLFHTNDDAVTEASERLPRILYEVTDGTGDSQMDILYHDQRTIAASGTDEVDLYGGEFDTYGALVNLVEVKLIIIKASSENTNNVLVGGAASNTFINWVSAANDVVVVKPGGILFLYAPDDPGYAVTASTGDKLKLANSSSGTSVVCDVYIGGVSA